MQASSPAGRETPPVPPSRVRRWLRTGPGRLAFFTLVAVVLFGILQVALMAVGWAAPDAPPVERAIGVLLRQCVPFVVAYLLVVRWVEGRPVDELAWRRILADGALGSAGGVLLIGVVVGLLWLAGSYVVTDVNPDAPWLRPLLVAGIGAAVSEEIIFRGMLFRIAQEESGTWAALAMSALFFGGVHIANPNATLWSSFAIAVEAGLLLGAIFHVTRSLPLCMGVHMAWNFAQGTVFGIPVSGTKSRGWLVSEVSGPEWLTGGAFGVEASVITVFLSLGVTVALLAWARRQGTIVAWRPRRRLT